MNTPIVDFVKGYAESKASRLHMPGHKGKSVIGVEPFDITEIDGADVLYSPDGIILESENNATELFKTAHTFYSVEGSSLCIKAMLSLATLGKEPLILAARNVHKSFLYGAALLDLSVEWLYPDENEHICSCVVSEESLNVKLQGMDKLPSAVYVTSPDYLGNMQDIKGLAEVCHGFGIPLIVDNAHGAYLRFMKDDRHPITLGADMCCDSAHKTLPVLTGGAYLHISKNAPKGFCDNARRFLSVFASTSPSYVTMQSLDLCNKALSGGFAEKLQQAADKVMSLKKQLTDNGWCLLGDEPLKLTLKCSTNGLCGEKVAKVFRENGIECEFYDRDVVVMMFSADTENETFDSVLKVLQSLKRNTTAVIKTTELPCTITFGNLSIRKALFSEQETVSVDSAVGRICAAPNVSCPPAVPPVMSGEVITKETVEILKYYDIKEIDVVK